MLGMGWEKGKAKRTSNLGHGLVFSEVLVHPRLGSVCIGIILKLWKEQFIVACTNRTCLISYKVIKHTQNIECSYNAFQREDDAKEPEYDIEATRMLRLAGLRRVLKFPRRLHLDEEARLYQPFEFSQNKRIWASHLKFFGYYNDKEKEFDIEEERVARMCTTRSRHGHFIFIETSKTSTFSNTNVLALSQII